MHDKIIVAALERERRRLSGLTIPEVDQLRALLGRLHANVRLVNSDHSAQGRDAAQV